MNKVETNLNSRQSKIRKVFILIASVILLTVIFFSFFLNISENIKNINIIFENKLDIFSEKQILDMVEEKKIINTKSKINLEDLRDKLQKTKWISEAQPYIINQNLSIKIRFSIPVAKILNDSNELVYLNEKAETMNVVENISLKVPLFLSANLGNNDSSGNKIKHEISKMASIISKKDSAVIDHINIRDTNNVLVYTKQPRVKYYIGNIKNSLSKISKVLFFHEYMRKNKIRFSEVNVSYNNQITGVN